MGLGPRPTALCTIRGAEACFPKSDSVPRRTLSGPGYFEYHLLKHELDVSGCVKRP
jgi:hypothetical protein